MTLLKALFELKIKFCKIGFKLKIGFHKTNTDQTSCFAKSVLIKNKILQNRFKLKPEFYKIDFMFKIHKIMLS